LLRPFDAGGSGVGGSALEYWVLGSGYTGVPLLRLRVKVPIESRAAPAPPQ
jgi:hypothetical protein